MESPATVPVTTVIAGYLGENPTDAEHDNQVTTTTHLNEQEANNDDDDDDDDDEEEDEDDDTKDAYYEARNGNESDELETAFQSSLTLASDVRVNICDAEAEAAAADDDNDVHNDAVNVAHDETLTEDARAEQQLPVATNPSKSLNKSNFIYILS